MHSVVKIDTKGTCLLCLRSTSANCRLSEDKEEDSTTSLKTLFRYLKIDISKLASFSTLLQLRNGDNLNLSVLLCDDCSAAADDFNDLFLEMENIRLQLDLCVRQLHEFMEKGSKDLERVREYESRMTSDNISDMISSRISSSLRTEIVDKVCQKLQLSLPRIVLENCSDAVFRDKFITTRPPPPPIRPENENFTSEDLVPSISIGSPVVSEQLQPVNKETCVSAHSFSSLNQGENVVVAFNAKVKSEESNPLAEHEQLQISLLKCAYCSKWFSQQKYLQTHLFRKHTMEVLSDQGFLPSNISKLQLEGALVEFTQNMKSRAAKCPFCTRRGFQSEHNVRQHLLQKHLHHVAEKAESVTINKSESETISQLPEKLEDTTTKNCISTADPKSRKRRKCKYCGRYFPSTSMSRHQLRLHMMMVLKDKIPNSVSEQSMIEALNRIQNKARVIRQRGGNVFQCLFCESEVWSLRDHLLRIHLNEVIQETNESQDISSSQSQNMQFISAQNKSSPHKQTQVSNFVPTSNHKCSLCGKTMSTKIGLKMHFVKQHLKPHQKPLKCEHCENRFTRADTLKVHLVRFHPVAYFSDQLPAGISDQDFYDSVSDIVRQCKVTRKSSSNNKSLRNYVMACPHCKKRCNLMHEFRSHISSSHLNEVVEGIKLRLCVSS